jgi:gliding motility-associated-like protein
MILKPKQGQRKSDIDIPDDTNIYRVGHKLAKEILGACKQLNTAPKELTFDYSNTPTKVTALEKHIGQSGWLQVSHLEINSFEFEDFLITACITDNGETINNEIAQRFFSIQASEGQNIYAPDEIKKTLESIRFLKKNFVEDELEELDTRFKLDETIYVDANILEDNYNEFTLTVFDGCGYQVESSSIGIYEQCRIVVPNIITPNGDGSNDLFKIKNSEDYDRLELQIFNRWGNLIYENTDYQDDWSGIDQSGLPLTEGVYFYTVIPSGEKYVYREDENPLLLHGFVHIVR